MADLSADHNLLADCGLYCGACYHYRASFPEGEHLLQEAALRGRPVAGYTCRGCRSERLYIHPGCAACEIRACADRRGLRHCAECEEMPCERILAFQGDGRVHHRDVIANLEELRQLGEEHWLHEQDRRWRCLCGAPFSWYETVCQQCGAALDSYGPDPTLR